MHQEGAHQGLPCEGNLSAQVLFEKHKPPAVFLSRNAVLSSFATGRQTSLVVDIGHEGTTGAFSYALYTISHSPHGRGYQSV